MRTTLNIDNDVLRAVKELARIEGRTIGDVMSTLARRSIESGGGDATVRNGIPLLPGRPGAGLVTPDTVRHFHTER